MPLYFTPSTECEDIILDGVSIGAVDYYTVSKGEPHTIEYVIKDKINSLYTDQFTSFGALGMKTIIIPDSITSLGNEGFWTCYNLSSITIPNSVTSIGDGTFYGCYNLTSVIFSGTIAQWNAITKGSYWKQSVPTSCIVHCTDGDINI